MSDQKSLHKTLEKLLEDATKLSIALGEQGRHLQILVYIDGSNYKAKVFTVNNQNYMSNCDLIKCKLYPERYNNHQSTCDSCFQEIYYSRYNSDDCGYRSIISRDILERFGEEELDVLQDLIRNIEIGIIDSYNESLYSYPNSLKNYSNPILLMDFEIKGQDPDMIYKEINEIDFAQLPTLREVGSKYQPIFSLAAIYGKKENIPDKDVDVAHLEFPKNFRFSLMVYEK
jgi:hypothetical protein